MAEQRPSFPWYPKDWLGSASVSSMPLAAQGLYIRLISFAWLSEGLPGEEEALRRMAAVERAEWRRVWPIVAPLWEERDGRLYQRKLETVRQQTNDYTAARREAGRKGGRSSAEARREANGTAQPRSKPEANDQAKPNPSIAIASAKKKNPPTPKGAYTPDFERFWTSYPNGMDPNNPRRGVKLNAFTAWQKLNPDEALIAEMFAAVAWQRDTVGWTKDNGAYIPNVSTWLNGHRWEIERPAGPNGTLHDEPTTSTPIPFWQPPTRNGGPR